ncbi:MAG: TIGR04283 family arsenosugar biosynthesis glycosyltransferase [Verrucomicrobiota bacterium]|nr:TIGR04283 family arsenosugar biosynthesis glycosyltransferase [Verrucomicrobiota bacterium]
MKLSIIIPVANEAAALPQCLARLESSPNEIIVVDAQSEDDTCGIVERAGARLFSHPQRHRARQMNHGAAEASGSILLFLHADTLLPPGALAKIVRALDRPEVVGGAFIRRYLSPSLTLALTTRLAALRNRLIGWHLGDQAIFVRREVFEKLGGYRDMPIFEDLDFSRRLRSLGQTVTLAPPVLTSARRFAEKGPLRTTWDDLLLTRQYLSGKDPNDLCLPARDRIEPLQSYERLS